MIEQETQGGKFLPAFFVDVVELGAEFKRGELPLHMTYFPPLRAKFKPEYAEQLRRYINPMEPFDARVGQSAFFDSQEGPVHVLHMEKTDRLMVVHRALVAVLHNLPHVATYRLPYRPHITIDKDDTRLKEGDTIHIAGLSIVEKGENEDNWRVMAKIGLKGTGK